MEVRIQELTTLLESAPAAIESRFMKLPIHGGTPIYRERVYCYELYHQLRTRWTGTSPFTLNCHVDKRGHEALRNLQASNTVPDLLVHVPGDWNGNHAIIEIKHAGAHPDDILKDLTTLSIPHTRGVRSRHLSVLRRLAH